MKLSHLASILFVFCLCACGRSIQWQEGKLMTPPLPEHAAAVGDACTIELIPYGQTELRLTVFPVVK